MMKLYVDLPKLQSIILGKNALNGDDSDDRKMIDTSPYNYKNTLKMQGEFEYTYE